MNHARSFVAGSIIYKKPDGQIEVWKNNQEPAHPAYFIKITTEGQRGEQVPIDTQEQLDKFLEQYAEI